MTSEILVPTMASGQTNYQLAVSRPAGYRLVSTTPTVNRTLPRETAPAPGSREATLAVKVTDSPGVAIGTEGVTLTWV